MVNHGRWALGAGSQQECNINCTFSLSIYIYIASVFIYRYIYILHIFIALMFKQSGVHLFVDLLMYIEMYVYSSFNYIIYILIIDL